MSGKETKIVSLGRFGAEQRFVINRNFFKRTDISVIESMPGGKEIILFYIKLLCECAGDNNGKTHGQITNNMNLISARTNTPHATVLCGLKLFEQSGMIKIKDGVINILGGYYNE